MPKITCPHCGKSYSVEHERIGQAVKCRCGEKFIATSEAEEIELEAIVESPVNVPLTNESISRPTFQFEELPKYRGLKIIAYLAEGIGALILIAALYVFAAAVSTSGEQAAPFLVMPMILGLVVSGIFLIALSEIVKLLIRMQHDAQRSRQYLNHIAAMVLEQIYGR